MLKIKDEWRIRWKVFSLDSFLLFFSPILVNTVEDDGTYFVGGILSQLPQDITSLISVDQNESKEMFSPNFSDNW